MLNLIIVLAISLAVMILSSLPSFVLFNQSVSALASVVQITSAKADSSDLINGGFAKIAQGKNTVRVTFDYKGFDDNDHVLELRCSWDGVNYLKSNCSNESAESRITFTGPDGVARAYYVKTGTASRDLPAPPVPKTYTFGVKVLNENGNLSPAATWSFKMRASTNPPTGGNDQGTGGTSPQNLNKIKVTFKAITVNDDHTPDSNAPTPGFRGTPGFPSKTVLPGEWILYAYVQGKLVKLFDEKEVLSGKTYQFQGKEVTVNIKSTLPLSIFTIGADMTNACYAGLLPCGWCASFNRESQAAEIYTSPVALWKQKIHALQDQADCSEVKIPLGYVNDLILPPDYKSWLTPEELAKYQTGAFSKYILDMVTGPDFVSTKAKDFTLYYTVSVEPN